MVSPDLDRSSLQNALATPLILFDGQTEQERMIAARQMVERSFCLSAVLSGRLNWDDYLMLLDDHGIDCINTHEMFEEGIYLL
ncbi:MAG: hypothetical protein AAGL08_13895 [Cyanobacteria bacterium J06573_11]